MRAQRCSCPAWGSILHSTMQHAKENKPPSTQHWVSPRVSRRAAPSPLPEPVTSRNDHGNVRYRSAKTSNKQGRDANFVLLLGQEFNSSNSSHKVVSLVTLFPGCKFFKWASMRSSAFPGLEKGSVTVTAF